VHCRLNNYGRGNRFDHASPQWLYWLHNRHNRHNDRALLRFRYFLRLSFPVAQVVDNYHGLPILAVFVDKEEVNHVLLLAVVLTKSNARDLVERVENVSSVASVWFSIVHYLLHHDFDGCVLSVHDILALVVVSDSVAGDSGPGRGAISSSVPCKTLFAVISTVVMRSQC